MNLYEVKTNEQYGSIVPILADTYVVADRSLNFFVGDEMVASFWNHEWKYVEKVVREEDE